MYESNMDESILFRKHFNTDDRDKIKAALNDDLLSFTEERPVQEWVKITLPFYAPDPSLPPIPTPNDVENSRTEQYIRSDRAEADSHVYRVSSVYAVKFSKSKILMQEAENLLFLQDYKVRSPKIYAAFSHQGADPLGRTIGAGVTKALNRSQLPTYYYLVMEYLDGITLNDEMWKDLEPTARAKICGKLAEQLQLLRSIPNPGYYGRINHQGYDPLYKIVQYRFKNIIGPFDTYEAFLQQMYNTFEMKVIQNFVYTNELEPRQRLFTAIFYDCFDKSSKGGEPKLSHMDLKFENMMLVPSTSKIPSTSNPSTSNPLNRIEDYDFYLIDWEMMAWLPAWAEIAGGLFRLPRDDDHMLVQWELSKGIRPFYYAEARFYFECCNALGGML